MKDRIYQQLEFAKGKLDVAVREGDKQEVATWGGYIQGLRFVLGLGDSSEVVKVKVEENSAHGYTEGSDYEKA